MFEIMERRTGLHCGQFRTRTATDAYLAMVQAEGFSAFVKHGVVHVDLDAREWVGLPGEYRITDMLTGQPVEVQ